VINKQLSARTAVGVAIATAAAVVVTVLVAGGTPSTRTMVGPGSASTGSTAEETPVIRTVWTGFLPRPTKPVTGRALRAAKRQVAQMLGAASIPSGAQPTHHLQSKALAVPGVRDACNPVEEGTEKWLVPEAPSTLVAFFEHHAPPAMTQESALPDPGAGSVLAYFAADSEKANGDDLLEISFTPVGSRTGLRIDAIVVPAGSSCASGAQG